MVPFSASSMDIRQPMSKFGDLVDIDKRTVSPHAFFDPEVYRAEQQHIFGRCWLYLGHDCQLPEPGNFITAYMGEEPIIVWRGPDGAVRAFIDSCRHRGMKICRLDEGSAARLTCPYHAWTYNSQGELVGRPEQHKYSASFDASAWGLIPVPRVASYGGFIFGCFDKNAVDLEEYLGDIKWYLDTQLKRTPEGRVIFPGVQKWTINTNWKFVCEQLSGDNCSQTNFQLVLIVHFWTPGNMTRPSGVRFNCVSRYHLISPRYSSRSTAFLSKQPKMNPP